MDIEEVAEKHPEKIFREHIDPRRWHHAVFRRARLPPHLDSRAICSARASSSSPSVL
ncbi:MAG: hypothetical protein WDN00_14255 [Limisphaerales bacterium]